GGGAAAVGRAGPARAPGRLRHRGGSQAPGRAQAGPVGGVRGVRGAVVAGAGVALGPGAAVVSARAIWKGVLRLEDVEVPVKLYSAVEDKRVSFRLLHREDGVPVKQVMVNPDTGKVVEYEDIQRGYVTPEGRIVRLDPSELDELEPEPSRDIEVLRFVPPDAIEHRWFERPYYLGPDGDADAYFALAAALA